ncbi:methyl-accepting chemotaxis protein [Neiella marina]|uniref:Methyl-accepting chemotaxis protein n=1 Tax=Neiella marina TaxID=508461 RepID=A0A8J2U939_9GAMM|nr:methyl-accepting chemotaxis protein [Neiella marina]GGA87790.1 methyl-accepting chemotaxis protein [Neiella marina]
MLGNHFQLRLKLTHLIAVLVFIPLLILIVMLVRAVFTAHQQVQQAQARQSMVALVAAMDGVAHQHAVERGLTAGFLGSKGTKLRGELASQRGKADKAEKVLVDYAQQSLLVKQSPAIEKAIVGVQRLLRQKGRVRQLVDSLDPSAGAFAYYSNLNRQALNGLQTAMLQLSDPSLGNEVEGLRLLLWLKERAGQARGAMNGAYASKKVSPLKFADIQFYINEINELQKLIDMRMPTPWYQQYQQILQQSAWQQVGQLEQQFLAQTNLNAIQGPEPSVWFGLATDRIKLIKSEADQLSQFLLSHAATQAQSSRQSFWLYACLSVALVIIVVAITSVTMNSTARRVKGIRHVLADAALNKDLSGRTKETAGDELGTIGASVDQMMTELSDIIERVVEISANTSATTDQIDNASNRASDCTAQHHSKTDQIASAIAEMAQSSEEIAGLTEKTFALTGEAEQRGSFSQNKTSEARQSIEHLVASLSESNRVVIDLAKTAEEVSGILDTISGISEQTNLLALNAAIEAARAGELGRGFAVVADEVRNLATKSQQATEEIREVIGAIHDSAESAIEHMNASVETGGRSMSLFDESMTSLQQLFDEIQQVRSMNEQISTAAQQQSCVAQEISERVSDAVDYSNQTLTAVAETKQISVELKKSGDELIARVAGFNTASN